MAESMIDSMDLAEQVAEEREIRWHIANIARHVEHDREAAHWLLAYFLGALPPPSPSRLDPEVREWRMAIFTRDDFRCVRCASTDELQAHHIKSWSKFPECRLDIDNGETLCATCHAKEHPKQAHVIRAAARRRRG